MIYRVEIRSKDGFSDPHADGIAHQIEELGIDSVSAVKHSRLFFLIGELSQEQASQAAGQLLIDPVTEEFTLGSTPQPADQRLIEVHLQPGVMDPVAASTQKAIADMGFDISDVRTARRYELAGEISDDQCEAITRKLLANAVIEDAFFEPHTPPESTAHSYELNVVTVPVCDLDDAGLEKLSKDGELFLNLTEMKAIQDHFRSLGRDPFDVEVEMIAQTWSEHCGHKTFRSDVSVKNNAGEVVEEIPNLIKNTIFGSTHTLNKPWCLNIFEDNAGVVEFDDKHAICFKVETHNHPSALEPYGGAMTGIGGVVRDPMGTGLGAQPVANSDVFCFGHVDMDLEAVPKGVLHPRRVMRRVVAGVRDYGNRMGIPTINGAVYFDDRYVGNPLVFCGTVGLMDRDKCTKRWPEHGDAIICVGGRTGRDGIHGATFSSGELTHEHETEFSHAVQIGNAITEKKVLDTVIQARDLDLFDAITDCGAGGLSSAVGEMGEKIGAQVHIERIPLKYSGLSYWETWISEAQERMVLAVKPENVDTILKLFSDEDVEATVIGHYGTDDRKLKLFYNDTQVADLDMEFLHDGLPRPTKEAVYEKVPVASPMAPAQDNYNETLKKLLASPNITSKEWVIRQYDHEVQGGSVIKPLVGVGEDGPGNASVIRPVLTSQKGVALSCGMNPRFGDLDPYQSALHAIDEALRNLVSVGGNLERTAILDNFCWGNCNKPDRMGGLVQSAKACRDAALVYETPFISGKDSLNNEFQTDEGETIAIPSTLLISAISIVDDANKCVTSDAKTAGNHLLVLGKTGGKLGGSHYLLVEGLETGNDVPEVDLAGNNKLMLALQGAISDGLVRSCHDLSEGGLAVAAAEIAFSGGLGVELDVQAMVKDESANTQSLLFAEDAGRFIVEVTPDNFDAICRKFKDIPFGQAGKVTDTGKVVIGSDNKTLIDLDIDAAKQAWQGTLDW